MIPRRGITLLEVLVTIALTLALLGAMSGFFWDLLDARDRILERTAQQRCATTLLDGIERDLCTCIVGDRTHGAGVAGDETSLRLLSRRVPVHELHDGQSVTNTFADLERSEYQFRARTVEASRHVVSGRGASRGGSFHDLGAEVYKVRFRYHDGAIWRDSFDSLQADRLPTAIEVAIWFEPWAGAEEEEPPPTDNKAADAALTDDGAFDEFEFAMESDFELAQDPPPDRLRVIVIPDATEPGEGGESG